LGGNSDRFIVGTRVPDSWHGKSNSVGLKRHWDDFYPSFILLNIVVIILNNNKKIFNPASAAGKSEEAITLQQRQKRTATTGWFIVCDTNDHNHTNGSSS